MAGAPGRSGGHNAISLEDHVLRGSFRPDRHSHLTDTPSSGKEVSAADRRRTLDGLPPAARRLAAQLLSEFVEWDAAGLRTLRSYVLSCERLAALEDAPGDGKALHRELRSNVALLRQLGLER